LLVAHGRDGLVVGGVEDETLMDCLKHKRAQVKLLDDVLDDPALATHAGLLQGDGTAGIEVRDDAPSDINGARETSFQANHAATARVDPDPAFETGERLGFHRWRRPCGIWFKVEDDEGGVAGGLVGELGLAGGIAPEHGVGHQLKQIDAHLLVLLFAVDVTGKTGGRGEQVVEALAFCCILGRSEWTAIALNEPCDTALGGLDLVAQMVALFVDHMQAIA